MDQGIDNYKTVQEAADVLQVQYYTLLSWIKKNVGGILTDDMAVKKSSWLIHNDAITRLKGMIKRKEITSEKPS